MGRLAPAQRVSDYQVARELGISRAPVREALSRLASEGLVELMPKYGAFVRMLSRHELDTMRHFRFVLEMDAIGQTAVRIGPADIRRLRAGLRRMIGCARRMIERGHSNQDAARFLALDLAFHRRIVRVAGNPWVLKAFSELQALVQMLGLASWTPDDDLAPRLVRVVRAHRRVLAAIARHDTDAAQAELRRHLSGGAALTQKEYDRLMRVQRQRLESQRRSHWPRELLARVERRESPHTPGAMELACR